MAIDLDSERWDAPVLLPRHAREGKAEHTTPSLLAVPTTMKIHVLFLCLGNICRSPLAEGVFRAHLEREGLDDRFVVDSAGTSSYHVGEPPDRGSVRIAKSHGIDLSRQRSRQLVDQDYQRFDFIVPMDRSNRTGLLRRGTLPDERTVLIRDFDPEALGDFDVPDPWGGGGDGFAEVYRILERCMPGFTAHALHHGRAERP